MKPECIDKQLLNKYGMIRHISLSRWLSYWYFVCLITIQDDVDIRQEILNLASEAKVKFSI
jgi:hypothetical protein